MRKTLVQIALLVLCVILPGAALAVDSLSIDIYGPGQSKLNLVLTKPLNADGSASTPANAETLQHYMQTNLNFLPFLNMVAASSILGGDSPGGVKGEQIDFSRYKKSNADIIITSGWTPSGDGSGNVELRAFSVYNGQLLLGKAYMAATKDQLPIIANRFCAQLMELLTGKKGFFDSMIAFAKRSGSGREIWVVGPTGQGLRQITNLRGISMSPSWSPDGRHIAFTHIGPTEHTLGVWDAASNTVKTIKLPGNAVISPSYMPSGTLAVALNSGGTSNIVTLSSDYKVQGKLTNQSGIDVSPSFSDSGNMVYVSSKLGNPHIFAGGGRISNEGKYNTNPTISPDGTMVAYSRQFSDGHHIILHDMQSGSEKQVTFGPGSDEHPSFSPDGYFIVFASTRGGGTKLYLTTRHGDPAVQIPTGDGDAYTPSWSKSGAGDNK